MDAQLNQAIVQEQTSSAPILASDRDAGAIRTAQANAERAGVINNIQFSCQAFSNINPPENTGWIVSNPPYGIRVSAMHDLRNLLLNWVMSSKKFVGLECQYLMFQ